ncbi:MAG: lipoate--protein ligase family protein [Candidatus Firestonebacteria bacterium]
MKRSKWRLFLTKNLAGFTNMAIDEVLLLESGKRKSNYEGNLRFYTWKNPTISLGYFQKAEDVIDVKRCKNLGISLVRRITGGGAIYHNAEITYSITTFLPNPVVSSNIELSYKVLESFLIKGISELGVNVNFRNEVEKDNSSFYCFANPSKYDIVFNDKKLIGSAQRRSKKCFLQHGSILLNLNDTDKMFSVFKDNKDKAISEFKESTTTLEDLLKKKININEVIDVFIKKFEEEFNVDLVLNEFTNSEKKLIKELEKKYINVTEGKDETNIN